MTPIKCTGLNCPMQVGKVDPATCKAADTCEWATKPLTNADKIRAMSNEELAHVLRCLPEQTPPDEENCNTYNCYLCTINWLKQEVKDNG